jgi:hypothetical protein
VRSVSASVRDTGRCGHDGRRLLVVLHVRDR